MTHMTIPNLELKPIIMMYSQKSPELSVASFEVVVAQLEAYQVPGPLGIIAALATRVLEPSKKALKGSGQV